MSFDEEDDEMADLFAFATASPESKKEVLDVSNVVDSVVPLPRNIDEESTHSGDSFIEMLEERKEVAVIGASTVQRKKENDETKDYDETNIQEILDWLDEDDERENDNKEEELAFVAPPKHLSMEPSNLLPAPIPPSPEFATLEQAVKSSKSTLNQIRDLLEQERFLVSATTRPHLWCRVVCGKSLDETLQSSVADSFQEWEQHWHQQQQQKLPIDEHQQQQLSWIQKESSALSDRIATVKKVDSEICQRELSTILLNHYNTGTKQHHDQGDEQDLADPLLPPVVCAILSAGVPKVAASVMLSHIVPHFMPILALTTSEREQAALTLHRQFYLLACYHLPLLVLHLDRYLPDWYKWPPGGFLPQSYLISHLAGECGGAFMNPLCLQSLWDLILTSSNNSLRFFMVMSILETNADRLLLLTGDALKEELEKAISFNKGTTKDGLETESDDQMTTEQASRWVHEWTDRAQLLWEQTPLSVVRVVKHSEDLAVKEALTRRQEEAELRLKLKLEAQAKAHQEALEAERERKADQARLRLTRARLVAFYRQYNPENEHNIDKIMKTYEGRYDILDTKLRKKYGVGFNPALKPKKNSTPNKLLSSMNQRRVQLFGGNRKGDDEKDSGKPKQVVVQTAPSEVVPVVCWSKQSNEAKFSKAKKDSNGENVDAQRVPLKFYLVDTRPENIVRDQGKFPDSIALSPEMFLDPNRLKEQEGLFEPLRGSVHIVIMGEGYSALPKLYGHKMTPALANCIKEDEARNNNCALFFLKKGFPFVSTLLGGFAQAHAWLCRAGPEKGLHAESILEEYNPEVSLFGQFESLSNASGREKAQRSLQGIFDSSMAALTKNAMRLESMASAKGNGEDQQRDEVAAEEKTADLPKANPFSGFGAAVNNSRIISKPTSLGSSNSATKQNLPRNPFARFGMSNLGNTQTANKGVGMANPLAGLNQFRKNTVARMRSGANDSLETSKPSSKLPVGEECFSLDQSSPSLASSAPESEHRTTSGPHIQLSVEAPTNAPPSAANITKESAVFDQSSPAIASNLSDSSKQQHSNETRPLDTTLKASKSIEGKAAEESNQSGGKTT